MTLMEAVTALVIVALVAIGCLEVTQGASSLEHSATEWNAAVSLAESRMAQVTTSAGSETALGAIETTPAALARHNATQVTRTPWNAGLDMIAVSVPVSGDKRYVLRRLVPTRGARVSSVRIDALPGTARP
ncbi:MAG: hypothetical protein ACO1Q7_20925 [Gemmatimonas sp.]